MTLIAAVGNDSGYGLGAGIWTQDIAKAHALAKKLRAYTVWIGCGVAFRRNAPRPPVSPTACSLAVVEWLELASAWASCGRLPAVRLAAGQGPW